MKKALQNRLKTYASLAAGVMAASTAGAQIVYTDVDPDVTINTIPSNFGIDFNGDMLNEFNVEMVAGASSSPFVARLDPLNTSNSFVTSSNYLAPLAINNAISSSNFFQNSGYARAMLSVYTYYSWGPYGNWGGTNIDKYIGVKFNISGNTHYGWIRVDADLSTTTPSAWSITIKDYAYQSIPDSSILAGDMGGTTNLNQRFATTKIFAANKQINLAFNKADYSNTQISVYNNLGQLVHQQEATNQKESIDMSAYPMGLYIVKLQTAGAVLSKKIILR